MHASEHSVVDRTGLSPVAGCDDDRRAADVGFIHGLGGGSPSTWMASDEPASFWPAWLGEDYPDLGIWTLGYAADVSAWKAESMPLADGGTMILEVLANENIGDRPLVFITHSMGGLLAKQLLRHATSFG